MKRIRFKGTEYLFKGDSLDESGFIATRNQYENAQTSFAHYYPGLGIMRFNEKIGSAEDIEIIGDANISMDPDAAENMMDRRSFTDQ